MTRISESDDIVSRHSNIMIIGKCDSSSDMSYADCSYTHTYTVSSFFYIYMK